MKLSVIIWSFKAESKLAFCLNSLLKNDVKKNLEIIVCNDGYNDKSIDIVNDFNEKYPKQIKLLSNSSSLGEPKSINNALKHVTGEYFLVMNYDTIASKNFIKAILDNIKNNNEPDIIEFLIQYNSDKHIMKTFLRKDVYLEIKKEKEVFADIHPRIFSKVFKTEIMKRHNIEFIPYKEYSTAFIYSFLLFSNTLTLIDEPLAIIDKRDINTFNTFDCLDQWEEIRKVYKKMDLYDKYEEELEYAFTKYSIYYFLSLVKKSSNKMYFQKAVTTVKKSFKDIHLEKNRYIRIKSDFNKKLLNFIVNKKSDKSDLF